VTARLSPRSEARSGKPLRVAIDLERLYFFDPESQEAIV
jgi:multiple sugar transport system ATP-binding protein